MCLRKQFSDLFLNRIPVANLSCEFEFCASLGWISSFDYSYVVKSLFFFFFTSSWILFSCFFFFLKESFVRTHRSCSWHRRLVITHCGETTKQKLHTSWNHSQEHRKKVWLRREKAERTVQGELSHPSSLFFFFSLPCCFMCVLHETALFRSRTSIFPFVSLFSLI